MFKAQFLYQGRKPDVSELEAYFPKLEATYKRLSGNLKVSPDPFYKINTLDWPWFRSRFDASGYHIRCIITKEGALKAAGVVGHNGFYNLDTDGVHDFYVTDIKKSYRKASLNGFKTALAYMVIHEFMHGVRWNQTGDRFKAVQDVHKWVEAGTLKQNFEAYIRSLEPADISREEQLSMLANIKRQLLDLLKRVTTIPPLLPVTYLGITQNYGTVNWKLYPATGRHWGLDLRAAYGTPVTAPLSGEVIESGFDASLGYWLQFFDGKHYHIIPHLAGPVSLRRYAQGEQMGVIGKTGKITGVHCHLEIWTERMTKRTEQLKKRGTSITIDPAKYYNLV